MRAHWRAGATDATGTPPTCGGAALPTGAGALLAGALGGGTEEKVFEGSERHGEYDGEAPPREHTVRHVVITLMSGLVAVRRV